MPDEDAYWRLTGGHGLPPSRQSERARAGDADAHPAGVVERQLVPAASRYNAIIATLIAAIVVVMLVDIIGSAGLYGAAAAMTDFMNSGPAFPGALLYIAIGAIPVTLIHELGHAIAARHLLDTPVSVAIGSIGKVARLRLGEISMSINAIGSPAGVAGSAEFDATNAYARDILWIALAGPAASAVGFMVSVGALAATPAGGLLHGFFWATVLGGAFGVLNLIPFSYQDRRGGPTHQTDGRLALDAARTLRALR